MTIKFKCPKCGDTRIEEIMGIAKEILLDEE